MREQSRMHPAFAAGACLRTLGALAACEVCARECPVDAVAPTERGVEITEHCLGCARCVAVCPTGALDSPRNGIPALVRQTAANRSLRIECERVPPGLRAGNTVQASCLGALGVNELLGLREHAGDAPIEIVDRGWCPSCPVGGAMQPPGAAARARVAELCAAMGIAESGTRLVADATPAGKRDDDVTQRRARRAFLGRLLEPGNRTDPPPATGKDRRRVDFLHRLRRISARWNAPLPPGAHPAVRIGEQCCNHGMCASVCPTGALITYQAGERSGIEFEVERCIGCGACAVACPEHALGVVHARTDASPPVRERLTAHRTRRCERCDADYTAAADDQQYCPACRKGLGLFKPKAA